MISIILRTDSHILKNEDEVGCAALGLAMAGPVGAVIGGSVGALLSSSRPLASSVKIWESDTGLSH